MKIIYSISIKKLLFAVKNAKKIILEWSKELNKDFSFYNRNTELLAIWSVLFMTITGLFAIAINSNILAIFLLTGIAIAVTLITSTIAVLYLHAIKFQHKKRLLPKIHKFLNKSFKIRSLLKFIRLPSFKLNLSFVKNFKHLIKFKIAS